MPAHQVPNLMVLLCTADRQSNMQMNKPIWVVEDRELMKSPEGRRKLQDTANDHKRLLVIHGADFDKVSAAVCHMLHPY